MAGFSDYLENKLIDHVNGKTSYTMPTEYIGVSTADPLDDKSGLAEPSGSGYARVATTGATWNAGSSGSATNAAAITFPTATGAWGTITHFATFDAATAGNMLESGELDTPQAITTNQILRFDADALTKTYG